MNQARAPDAKRELLILGRRMRMVAGLDYGEIVVQIHQGRVTVKVTTSFRDVEEPEAS